MEAKSMIPEGKERQMLISRDGFLIAGLVRIYTAVKCSKFIDGFEIEKECVAALSQLGVHLDCGPNEKKE